MASKNWIGKKVKIDTDCSGRQPSCDGQTGTITGIKQFGTASSPTITLDDGSTIGGWECWWDYADEPILS